MTAPEYLVFTKSDCPTCALVAPVLRKLGAAASLKVYNQDGHHFPDGIDGVRFDADLDESWAHAIETVPTLIRREDGAEVRRTVGWDAAEWQAVTDLEDLGHGLPPFRPGCGSLSMDPDRHAALRARHDIPKLARQVALGADEDPVEACHARGWSDGLPVVPPTPERVARMLEGTTRAPTEVIGDVPPDLAPCTVTKVAVNAVMAGCLPEYLPVVLAAVEAALEEPFCMHGLLATTYFSGPMVVVSGPVARHIGMNSGGNALGQGNRANASIGRALQLVIRNVGGGKPGGVDRACLGNPGKYTFCFAEADDPAWTRVHEDAGLERDRSAVTLFAADGVTGVVDQKARDPESLCRSFAATLRTVGHVKMVLAADAFLVVSPEHARVFHDAGWTKEQLVARLHELLVIPGAELVAGADGIAEGLPEALRDRQLPKFREGGLRVVRAGGDAGLFSAVIAGWGASGSIGSSPVTRTIGA